VNLAALQQTLSYMTVLVAKFWQAWHVHQHPLPSPLRAVAAAAAAGAHAAAYLRVGVWEVCDAPLAAAGCVRPVEADEVRLRRLLGRLAAQQQLQTVQAHRGILHSKTGSSTTALVQNAAA
jgi:hypothetical protein